MNRDEQRSRPIALPPSTHQKNGRTLAYPSEPSGGTWIGVNNNGVCLALINWYSAPRRVSGAPISRGIIIPSTLNAEAWTEVDAEIKQLTLKQINPFRLIGVFPQPCKIVEWSWDLNQLRRHEHPWRPQQWISSGFDEPRAQKVRSQTFQLARKQTTANTLPWLRRLHRSHQPGPGPFATCMHREDAQTVSYTEVLVSPRKAVLRYLNGPPCRLDSASSVTSLPLSHSR